MLFHNSRGTGLANYLSDLIILFSVSLPSVSIHEETSNPAMPPPGGAAVDGAAASLWIPVLMSALAGSATGLGGLIVFCLSEVPSDRVISFVLAYAAGVMT